GGGSRPAGRSHRHSRTRRMIGLAAILVGLGAALIVVGLLGRLQKKGEDLRELLDLPYGELDVPVPAVTESAGAWTFVRRAGTLASVARSSASGCSVDDRVVAVSRPHLPPVHPKHG